MTGNHIPKEIIQKIEHYCTYQERCHQEVIAKLKSMKADFAIIDKVLVHLISENFLNEERFAKCFARGKFRIKQWGKIRITNELKYRNISPNLIKIALNEISDEDYLLTFMNLAESYWTSTKEIIMLKKKKKCCDYLLRHGFESNLVFEKIKELEVLPIEH